MAQTMTDVRVGVDLGGTKIEILVLDRTGSVKARHRVPTPSGDYEATVRAVADLVRSLTTVARPSASAYRAPLAGDGPREERQLHLPHRTAIGPGSCESYWTSNSPNQ